MYIRYNSYEYMYMYVHICVYISFNVYIYIYLCICIDIFIYMYTYIYMHMYTYIHICINLYSHTQWLGTATLLVYLRATHWCNTWTIHRYTLACFLARISRVHRKLIFVWCIHRSTSTKTQKTNARWSMRLQRPYSSTTAVFVYMITT